MTVSFSHIVFKRRGALMAAVAVVVLCHGRPSLLSLAMGVMLGLAGESLRFWSIGYSRGHTRGLEVQGPFLATGGPYARCRNPLYLGNALNSLGAAVAAVGRCPWETGVALMALTVISLGLVYGTIIPLEEGYLSAMFGNRYEAYRAAVPRLIPRARAWTQGEGEFCLDSALYFERWTLFWWVSTWAWLAYRTG